jgi:hypothetical protein
MNKWPVYCFCGWLVVVTAHIAYFCLRPNSLGKLVLGRHCRRRKTPENPFHLPEDKKLIIYNPFVAQITVHNSPPQHLLPPAIDAWLRRCRSCASARTQGRGGRCWGGGKVTTGRGGGGGGQHLGLGFPGLGVRVLGVLHSPAAEGEGRGSAGDRAG